MNKRKILTPLFISLLTTATTTAATSTNTRTVAATTTSTRTTAATAAEQDSKECKELNARIEAAEAGIRDMSRQCAENACMLQAANDTISMLRADIDSLGIVCGEISQAQSNDRKHTESKFQATDTAVSTNQDALQSRSIWGGVIVLAIIAAIAVVAVWLTKRIKSGYSSIDEVRKAQERMQEESIKLDNRLMEIIDQQLKTAKAIQAAAPSTTNAAPDHSLAMKVADEIVRIELNLSRMDPSIRGYKQLSKAVERIKNNFMAKGYEIIDMLGKPYNEGMKVTANFVVDESLKEGELIITGITKPQINYNCKMIQAAQITVSQNI